jgi:5-(carboxyamino)imidazole ribonucleotide synthase
VNLLGQVPPVATLLAVPGAHLHLYGKAPKAGRKLGHVTIVGRDAAEVRHRLDRVRAAIT